MGGGPGDLCAWQDLNLIQAKAQNSTRPSANTAAPRVSCRRTIRARGPACPRVATAARVAELESNALVLSSENQRIKKDAHTQREQLAESQQACKALEAQLQESETSRQTAERRHGESQEIVKALQKKCSDADAAREAAEGKLAKAAAASEEAERQAAKAKARRSNSWPTCAGKRAGQHLWHVMES